MPITYAEIVAAQARIAPYIAVTPARRYQALDVAIGAGISVIVKHDNHLPTNAFKARNALSLLTSLPAEAKARGVVAATRGNHGMGLAWAGQTLGIAVTICVPVGNNREKNAAIVGYGATLIESGDSYDAAVLVADELVAKRGMTLAHSSNHHEIIAGAGTLTAELLDQAAFDAMVIAVGGGSQAVGAIIATQARRPMPIYAVGAEQAPAGARSWHNKQRMQVAAAATMADGLATRATYDLTWPTLCDGLADYVTVSEQEFAAACRLFVQTTHNLVEPAGAAGLAGLLKLRETLSGQRVAIVCSGANIDAATMKSIFG